MKNNIKYLLLVVVLVTAIASCTKMQDIGTLNTGNFSDTTGELKSAADFPIGVAVDYTPMLNDTKYSDIVKRDFDVVSFGYEMKHGAIVQDNGTLSYTKADALVAACGSLDIFGHTLGWHQNQNATYLKSYAGITIPAATELATNPGFESGLSGWATYNAQNGQPLLLLPYHQKCIVVPGR